MTKELFEKAKFGDRFVTRGGQEALFLRLTENAEWRFADFYVKDWGLIRVNRDNGKCLNGPDIENDIVGVKPSLPSDLNEAAEEIASDIAPTHPDIGWDECFDKIKDGIKAGVEWVAGQGVSMLGKVGIYGVDVESITKELREAGFNLGEEIILQIRKKQ